MASFAGNSTILNEGVAVSFAAPKRKLVVKIGSSTLTRADGSQEVVPCRCRIDTATELTYYQNDGILHYVIRKMLD